MDFFFKKLRRIPLQNAFMDVGVSIFSYFSDDAQ